MRTSRQVWAGGRPYSLTQEKSQEQNSDNLPSQVGFYRTRSILATLVTYSLTDCCLVDLIDVTLACEDANSILVEVVTVDAETQNKSLVQIWRLEFCRTKINFCSYFEHKVWS